MSLWSVDLLAWADPGVVASLSRVEVDRAARFRHRRDRDRYLAAHAALRSIVARHTGIAVAAQRYRRDVRGKWHLDAPSPWQFSLSYAADTALIGLSRRDAIGVDLELDRVIEEVDDLAATCFAPRELRRYAALPRERRDQAFLSSWTRKEAVLKAIGIGLRLPPADLDCGTVEDRTVHWGGVAIEVGSFRFDGLVAAWARMG